MPHTFKARVQASFKTDITVEAESQEEAKRLAEKMLEGEDIWTLTCSGTRDSIVINPKIKLVSVSCQNLEGMGGRS